MAIISYVAVGLGMIAAFRVVLLTARGQSSVSSPIWEVCAGFAAIVCVLTALVMIRSALEHDKTFILAIAATQLLFGIAAIGVFPTRWRPAIEGLAAVATGIFSFLTGFSIGIFLMPFALALGVAAWLHSGRAAAAAP